MTYGLTIKKVSNGFVVTDNNHDEFAIESVYQAEDEDDNSEREALMQAIDMMIQHFDLDYRKHHKPEDRFIKLTLVPGNTFWDDENDNL
jgi:signal transduction protein with GAF and PtsI domain